MSGRPRKLPWVYQYTLKNIVLARASDYGFETDFWTTRRLIQVFQSELGISVSRQTMLRRLHEAGLTYQKPEREYFELTEEERQEWVRTEVPKICAAVRKYRAILYFQDEANISLTLLLGLYLGTLRQDAETESDWEARRGVRTIRHYQRRATFVPPA